MIKKNTIPAWYKKEIFNSNSDLFADLLAKTFAKENTDTSMAEETVAFLGYMETDEAEILFPAWNNALLLHSEKNSSVRWGEFLINAATQWADKKDMEKAVFYMRIAHVNNQHLIFQYPDDKEAARLYKTTLGALTGGKELDSATADMNSTLSEFCSEQEEWLRGFMEKNPQNYFFADDLAKLAAFSVRRLHKNGDAAIAAKKLDAALRFFTHTLQKDAEQRNYRNAARLLLAVKPLLTDKENPLPRTIESLTQELEVLNTVLEIEPDLSGLNYFKAYCLKNLALAKEETEGIDVCTTLLKESVDLIEDKLESAIDRLLYLNIHTDVGVALVNAEQRKTDADFKRFLKELDSNKTEESAMSDEELAKLMEEKFPGLSDKAFLQLLEQEMNELKELAKEKKNNPAEKK
ncbi:MAG: hypothetical protein EA361_02390 [Bacteroidetes bacterium]|nr:MAG: hypothetical protein EA361_02390 [Bacteroidota bacterium]